MRIVHVVAVLVFGAACTLGGASQGPRKAAGDLPEIKELPNPFLFADGSAVRTRADWERRRVEVKALFQDYMYGHMPPKPQKMTVKKGERSTDDTNKVIIQNLEVVLEHEGKSFTMRVTVALPAGARGKIPVLIQSQGFGKGGGGGKRFKTYTDRGYAVAEFNWNAVAADIKGPRKGGIYTLFGNQIDTGTLMGWAWGISRVIDALAEAVPEVDATRVFITGHSRNGKGVLVAGAFDERIALTVPSHSGTGGFPPYRFVDEFAKRNGKAETLQNVVNYAPQWFRPDFKQFIGKVDRLPVDQHLLVALVAPRALMNTEGTKDIWTNPEGSQLAHLAGKKVYDFLKAGDKISIRYRPVGHIPSTEDLLAYADHVFQGKKLPEEFGQLPYRKETKGFTWDVPGAGK
ncbi:MAG: acetylxylan esterase [Gemmataceae bacterium]|nr:acetylxylan esterase [Gemmataceae bacterium]